MDEEFCIKCEILIKKPTAFDGLLQSKNQPVKFKTGWMCGRCSTKR